MPKSKRKHYLHGFALIFVMVLFVNALFLTFQVFSNLAVKSSAQEINVKIKEAQSDEELLNPNVKLVDIEIKNDYFNQVKIADNPDFIANPDIKDSGKWFYFDKKTVYENWPIKNIMADNVYLQLRKDSDVSRVLVLDYNHLANSANLTADLHIDSCDYWQNDLNYKFYIQVKDKKYYLKNTAENEYFYSNKNGEHFNLLAENVLASNGKIKVLYSDWDNYKLKMDILYKNHILDSLELLNANSPEKEVKLLVNADDYCSEIKNLRDKNYIVLYSKANYKGSRLVVKDNIDDLATYLFGTNNASSIKVYGDIKVKLFASPRYEGKILETENSIPDLSKYSFNKTLESIKFEFKK